MSTPVFRIAIAITAGLLVWAAGYRFFPALESNTALGEQSIPAYANTSVPDAQRAQLIDGRALYAGACQSCHQPSGQGLGKVFPPLDGTDWVTGDARRLALVVLQGMTGAVTVDGQVYTSVMPGFKSQFSDEEAAAVLSYIRSAWSNAAPPVSSDLVGRARDEVSDRIDPWRGEQELHGFLQALPGSGQENTP